MTRTLLAVAALLCAAPSFAADPLHDFDGWLTKWRAAGSDFERASLLTEGTRLARSRREAMAKLVRNQPAEALAHQHARSEVPAELAEFLEETLDASGTWEVLGVLGKDHRTGIETYAVVGSRRFGAQPWGQLVGLKTVPMRIRGLALDGFAAVSDAAAPRSRRDHTGGPQASPWTTGTKKLLYIRVDFNDAPGAPVSVTDATTAITQLNTYYKATSYNKTSIVGTVTNVLRMPQSKASYGNANNTSGLLADARAAAYAANPGSWDLDVVIFSGISAWGWAGLGYIGQKGVWINGAPAWDVMAHEIGHNYGLYHANFWQAGGETIIGAGSSLEYGNPFEIMGGGQGQHNAWYKYDLDWFGPTEVDFVTTSNTSRIYDLEQSITGGAHAAKVPISGARDYWVHFRPAAGGANANGVEINWGYPQSDSSDLLDMTPQTPGADDAPLVIGKTFSDFTAGIHITPTGLAATNPPSIDVVINRGLFAGNHSPTVSLMASGTQVTSGTAVTFTATAADQDGDALAYFWDFGDTSVSANSATQQRTLSGTKEVLARVTVTDMKGGTGTAWVVVRVGNPSTYRISGAVKEAGVGVEGVRVTSGTRNALTDSAGAYTLVGFNSGNFTVTAIKSGWTLNSTVANPVTVMGADRTGIDFVGLRALYTVSGHISSVGQPVVGATVSAGQYSTLTNAAGDYTLSGVPNGAYQLNAVGPLGEAFIAQFTNPIQINGANQANKNFVENVFPVSGEVLGLAGPHTVTDGIRTATTTLSGGHWVYTLPKVPPGSWNLVATAAGQLLTPTFTNPVVVSTAAVTLRNFNSVAGAGYVIRGHIDEAGANLVGCVVTDGTRSSDTDSLGFFSIANVPDGTVTVTPAKAGYQFSPNNKMVVIAGADSLTGNDFSVLNANAPPTIAFPPHATPSPVVGTTTQLTVLGDDPIEGELNLKYSWRQTFGVAPATFSINDTNASKTVTVTFTKPGAYSFAVDIIDGGGLKVSGQVTLLVLQTTTAVTVTPAGTVAAPIQVLVDATQQFVAAATDQFGGMVDFGGEAAWSVDVGGTISQTGKFTATAEGASVVTAVVNGKTGTSNVLVTVGTVPRIATAPTATPNPTFDDTTALSVLGSDDNGEANLTYKWSAVMPPAAVTFTPNGTNAAKNATAKFFGLGMYNLKVEITDADGLTTTGFLTVTVSSGPVTISIGSVEVMAGKSVTFVASAKDLAGASVAPGTCAWSVDGGGTIDAATGAFTAGNTSGSFNVTAVCGGKTGTVAFKVTGGGQGGGGGGKGCGCTSGSEGATP